MDRLSRDLILYICKFCALQTIGRLAKTCSRMRGIVDANRIFADYLCRLDPHVVMIDDDTLLRGKDAKDYVMKIYTELTKNWTGDAVPSINCDSILISHSILKKKFRPSAWKRHTRRITKIIFSLPDSEYYIMMKHVMDSGHLKFKSIRRIGKKRVLYKMSRFPGFENERYNVHSWIQTLPLFYE